MSKDLKRGDGLVVVVADTNLAIGAIGGNLVLLCHDLLFRTILSFLRPGDSRKGDIL